MVTPKSLAEKALIVKVSVSCWNGMIQDKKVTEDTNSSLGIKGKRGSFVKKIMQSDELNAVSNNQQKIRQFIMKVSLPWLDGGWRLVKSDSFIKTKQEIDGLIHEFNKSVQAFIDAYDRIKFEDMQMLKNAYDGKDYPSANELASKFGVYMHFDKISDNDFRNFGYDQSIIDEMEKGAMEEFESRLKAGKVEIINRLRDEIAHFAERLAKGSFKQNTINNITEAIKDLRDLNIGEDSAITSLADAIAGAMPTDAESVRDSESAMNDAKDVCKASIEEIDRLTADLLM